MSAAPSAQHIIFPASETRPGHERQVTSRAAWYRGLPQTPPAASANEEPISRPAPAPRTMSLEALCEWTCHNQRVLKYIRGPIDTFLWAADEADLLMNPADRRPVHIDALTVLEAIESLPAEAAWLVKHAALVGDWPQWMDEEECRPYPAEPRDPLDDYGYYRDADGARRRCLKRVVEIVSVAREEFEQVGRKKMKRAGATSWEQVPVEAWVIEYDPEPEFVAANNRLVALWEMTRPVLAAKIRAVALKDHVLAAEAPLPSAVAVAANDNEPLAANDNEPDQAAATG